MTPERAIQTEILHRFATRPDLRLWRANTGAAIDRTGRMIRFGVSGQADVSGIIGPTFGDGSWSGTRLEIEVKTAKGKQSDEQRAFGDMIQNFGGVYILARSAEDVQIVLDTLGDKRCVVAAAIGR